MIQIKYEDNDDNLFPLLNTLNFRSNDATYTNIEFTSKYRASITPVVINTFRLDII